MDVIFEIVTALGDWILLLIERVSGWRPAAALRERMQVFAASFTILGGFFTVYRSYKSALRWLGRGKILTPDERVLKDAITAEVRAAIKAEYAAQLTQREAVPEGATSALSAPHITASGDGLARDLDAAIDTLLAAGKADSLRDKSGAAADAALDQLIAERAKARERVAKDEAALWRQKGALAFLHDTYAARAAYARATELDPDDAEGWNELGHLDRRLGDLDAAATAFERVLALGRRVASKATIAAATGNLGMVYEIRGDLGRAEEMHLKALSIYEVLGRKEAIATAFGNLGGVYQTRGDLDGAEEMHLKSLALNEELGRKAGIAAACGNLGIVHGIRGNLDRAEEMFNKCLALNEVLGRKEGIAVQFGNLGNVYSIRGDLDRAEEMYRKALALDATLGRKEGMANQYGNLGNLYATRGDLDRAEKFYRESLALNEVIGSQIGIAINYDNLGRLEEERGNRVAACAHWTKARDLYRALSSPDAAKVEGWMREVNCGGV